MPRMLLNANTVHSAFEYHGITATKSFDVECILFENGRDLFSHCPRSIQSGVYVTVRRRTVHLSVHPPVCLSYRSTAATAAGGFAAERSVGRRYRSIRQTDGRMDG